MATGGKHDAATAELRTALHQADADRQRLARQAMDLTKAVERLMKFIVEINAQDFFAAGGEAIDKEKIQKAIDAAAQQAVKLVEADLTRRRAAFEKWRRQGEQILEQISRLVKQDVKVSVSVKHNASFTVSPPPAPAARQPVSGAAANGNVPRPQQRILDSLAWLESVGIGQARKTQLAILAEQSPKSSSYVNNLGALRTGGLIAYPDAGAVALTDAGRGLAQAAEQPPTTEALHESLYRRVSAPQGRILRALIAAYPDPLGKEDLATAAEQSASSSSYVNNLGALRSLGFIDYPAPGQVVALPVLFLDGAR